MYIVDFAADFFAGCAVTLTPSTGFFTNGATTMTMDSTAIGSAEIGRIGRNEVNVQFRQSDEFNSLIDTSFSIMVNCAT